MTSESPAPSATNVATNTTISATFNESVVGSSIVFSLKDSSGNVVAGAGTYNDTTHTFTFTPTSALSNSVTYTATVGGATDSSGHTMTAAVTWSFTTASPSLTTYSIFASTATPATVTVNDPNAVELGVKFQSDVSGSISGIRFYKGSSNTGTHTGKLWTSAGQLLATATFSGETASGWQQVTFASPVAITANTVYVASYHTAVGRYSANNNYFATGADNAPLHAPASSIVGGNGVYVYGASAFPTNTYQATNYWVDVVFTPGATAGVAAAAPAAQTAGTTASLNAATSLSTATITPSSGTSATTFSVGIASIGTTSAGSVAGNAVLLGNTSTTVFASTTRSSPAAVFA